MSNDSSSETKPAEQVHAQPRLPWGPVAAVLMVLFGFLVVPVAASVIVAVIPGLFSKNSIAADEWLLNSPTANFLYVLLAESMSIGALAWFISYKKRSFRQVVALRRWRWRDVGYALLAWVIYMALFVVVLGILQHFLPIDTNQQQDLGFQKGIGGIGLVMAFVSLVVLPPLVEEIVFRGFFFGTLRSSKLPFIGASLITSIIFASLHLFGSASGGLLWIAFIDTFVLSMVLCYLRERTDSIAACILLHALKNGTVFISLFVLKAV